MKRTLFISAFCVLTLIAAGFAARAAALAEIPFALEHNKIYFPDVFIGGKGPYRATLDTGSSHIGLDVALGAELGLVSKADMDVIATGGNTTAGRVDIPAMKIGSFDVFAEGQPAVLAGIRPQAASMGESIDIIIGYPLLRNYIVELDFPARKMRLYSSDGFTPPTGAEKLDLNLMFNVPMVPVSIEGNSATAMLDTGSNSALDTYPGFMARSGLEDARKMYDMPVLGLGGTVDTRLFLVKDMKIASFAFNSVKAYAHSRPLIGSSLDALIGTDILRRFTVTFDYKDSVVYFVPSKTDMTLPWDDERAGFAALQDTTGTVFVVAVIAESPAQRAGLVIGDKIMTMNGKPVSETGVGGLRRLVRGAPGEKLALTVERQGEASPKSISIVLEDYVK